ncbi:UV damage endonuclease UvsE [Candidatus Chloroploca sp. Khr17]|uniref:UV damage endonuclease UvsE n=1 Tax=Candidatus Chloroploca sp. Khr17 TaxID=2496869 RepID=UPI00101D4D7E|nr:UV damage endonuclease UvsE [Candidatus Chloroploca sp. Khr17]
MVRLGFVVRAIGRPGLASGGRRERGAHLSLDLARLGDMVGYLGQIQVRYYRAALALTAYDGFGQLAACADQLDLLAARVAQAGIRITLHLEHGLTLASAEAELAQRSAATIEAAAALLAALDGQRRSAQIEGIIVAHLGAAADDPLSYRRFALRYRALSPRARARLALEHEANGPSLGQLLVLHEQCGVPLVFDTLHWELHNPEGFSLPMALGLALATWPPGTRPEVHLSTQRTEAHLLPGRAGTPMRIVAPRVGQHADFIAPGDLIRLLVAARGLPAFDIMLEAKGGDLALARLRNDLARSAPDLAARLS